MFIASLILFLLNDFFELNKHPFILGINTGFGMSLSIIPFIFFIKNSKTTKRKKILEKMNKKNKSYEKYLILFLCAFFDFVQKILVFLFSHTLTNHTWFFNIIFLNLFTSMLTKNILYKHHYLSSGIIIL